MIRNSRPIGEVNADDIREEMYWLLQVLAIRGFRIELTVRLPTPREQRYSLWEQDLFPETVREDPAAEGNIS